MAAKTLSAFWCNVTNIKRRWYGRCNCGSCIGELMTTQMRTRCTTLADITWRWKTLRHWRSACYVSSNNKNKRMNDINILPADRFQMLWRVSICEHSKSTGFSNTRMLNKSDVWRFHLQFVSPGAHPGSGDKKRGRNGWPSGVLETLEMYRMYRMSVVPHLIWIHVSRSWVEKRRDGNTRHAIQTRTKRIGNDVRFWCMRLRVCDAPLFRCEIQGWFKMLKLRPDHLEVTARPFSSHQCDVAKCAAAGVWEFVEFFLNDCFFYCRWQMQHILVDPILFVKNHWVVFGQQQTAFEQTDSAPWVCWFPVKFSWL